MTDIIRGDARTKTPFGSVEFESTRTAIEIRNFARILPVATGHR